MCRLGRVDGGAGLGISLEGTVDVEEGVEVRPHHYIRSILPGSAVAAVSQFWQGDRLLEVRPVQGTVTCFTPGLQVNGVELAGLHHQQVLSE